MSSMDIQADKITYDKNKKQIKYKNALVKFMTYLFLFPKFFHPGPTKKTIRFLGTIY